MSSLRIALIAFLVVGAAAVLALVASRGRRAEPGREPDGESLSGAAVPAQPAEIISDRAPADLAERSRVPSSDSERASVPARAAGAPAAHARSEPADHPVLVARALDEAGRPLAGVELELYFELEYRDAWRSLVARTTTDVGGTLRIDGTAPVPELASLSLTLCQDRGVEPARTLRIALPVPLAVGLVDLGDLTLRATPATVTGRVKDADGEVVPGALVHVFEQRKAVGVDATYWQLNKELRGRANDDGRFEIQRTTPRGALALQAEAAGHAPSPPVVVLAGADGLELALGVSGAIAGRIVFRTGMGADDVKLELAGVITPGDGSRITPREREVAVQPDGRFRTPDLGAGRYRLELQSTREFGWDPLWSSDDIQVANGATTELTAIDLALLLREFRLRVVDTAGRPIASGEGTFWGKDQGWARDVSISNGVGRILTPYASVTCWVGAEGYRCVDLGEVAGDRDVVLERALRVRLRLRNTEVLPDPPVELHVGFRGRGPDNWVLEQISSAKAQLVGADGEIALTVPGPRRYWLSAYVERFGSTDYLRFGDGETPSFEVLDVPGEQVLSFDLDAGVFARAVEALGAPR